MLCMLPNCDNGWVIFFTLLKFTQSGFQFFFTEGCPRQSIQIWLPL